MRALAQMFDDQVARTPDAPAVHGSDGVTTYTALQAASATLADELADAGVRAGDVVGLVGDRGAPALAAMLAVLRRGAAYLPIDPSTPPRRVADMLRTTASGVVVTDGSDVADGVARTIRIGSTPVPTEQEPTADAGTAAASDHAYVMFTSGSTGAPKAVGVTHGGVARLATESGLLDLGPGNRVLHASTLAFDASTLEIWPALLNGACLVPVDSDLLLAPSSLHEHLERHEVDTAFFTTSLLHHLARARPEIFEGIEQVLTGGEALDAEFADVVVRRCGRLVNCYGPTEGTVVATAHEVVPAASGPVPIGRPLPYVDVHVVTDEGSEAGPGEVGELLIGGAGLATGYLGDQRRTDDRFVDVPGDDGSTSTTRRFYRTGDQVVRDADGVLEFRGRLDGQVKIRGHRVETGEVEYALRQAPGVEDAAVVDVPDPSGRRLAAFVVTPDGAPLDAPGIRRHLSSVLPGYMVPAEVIGVAEVPRAPSGKTDRAALRRRLDRPDPAPAASADVSGTVADRVAAAWRATLGTSSSRPDENFFDEGGTSLGAARLVARLQSALDLGGPAGHPLIRALLSAPTLDDFTGQVEAIVNGTNHGPVPTDRWHGDVFLPEVEALPTSDRGDRILLTGATGFFGSYLLHELLERTDDVVECLVRADGVESARRRILGAHERYGHGPLQHQDRVVARPGDLTAPRLGLERAEFDALAGRTNRIYHSAAQVNFVYPYEWLRPANVDGTRGVAELALRGGGVPVHYVSTIALLSGMGSANVRSLTESDPVKHVERMSMGYPESKWVAEKILSLAAERGVPVAVYRPYEITGSTRDGSWNTDAAIVAFFKAIVEMGTAPDAALPLDFVPADYLARALVHIAENPGAAATTYHLTNPDFALLSDMVDRLRAAGHPIRTIEYDRWVDSLRTFCAQHPDHPIVAFLPIFTTVANGRDVSVKELYFDDLFPRFDRSNSESGLRGSGITCPPVDADMLDSYIAWFHEIGWIRPPAPVGALDPA